MHLRCVLPLLLFAASPAFAQIAAPCGGAAVPGFAKPGAPPSIAVLRADDIARAHWTAPTCTGWPRASHSELVVALAGSFRFDGTLDALLARVGAISSLPKVLYWSHSAGGWRPVASDASALSSAVPKDRRADFSSADLAQGAMHYYWEDDSRLGGIVYRLSVRERGPDRAALTTENATEIDFGPLTISRPGATQSAMFLTRLSPGIWGLYILDRLGDRPAWPLAAPEHSLVNRTVALYRHIAAIPADAAPPAYP